MKKFSILLFLFITIPFSLGLQVNPTSWSVTVRPGASEQETFYVLNDQNATINVQISTNSSWIWLSKTSMSLSAFSSDSFNALLLVPSSASDGTYNWNISVDGKEILVTVIVQKWVWNKTVWVKEGSYVYFDGTNNGFRVVEVDFANDKVKIGEVESGSVTQTYWLNVGQSKEWSDKKLDVLDMFDDYVKLRFWSTETHTIEVEEESQPSQPSQVAGEFRFYVSEFGNTYVQGSSSMERFTLRNGLNEPVELKTITFEGTTIDKNGVRKPIRLEHYSLVTLEPGQEKSFDITIDTEGLDPGEYRCAFYVSGLGKNSGQVYTASVHFDIWVIEKIAPAGEETSLKIEMPSKVDVNEQFDIRVTGLKDDDTVVVYQLPEMVTVNVDRTPDEYVWTGKITKAGNYSIQINIIKGTGIALPFFKKIQVGEIKQGKNETEITIIPYPPKAGDTVSISVEPETTAEIKVYEDGTLVARYFYSSPFKVEAGKKYCVYAKPEGMEEKEVCFTIGKKKFKVTLTPSTPKVGDTLKVEVRNEDGSAFTGELTITINDKTFNAPVATYLIQNEEPISIKVEAEGYETYSSSITPRVQATNTSVIPSSVGVGSEVTIQLNRPALWEIRSGAEIVAFSNTPSSTISFTPQSEGDYDVYVEGTKIGTVHASAGLLSLPSLGGSWTSLVGGLALIGLVIFLLKKGKRKPKLGYSPYVEKGPVKVEE